MLLIHSDVRGGRDHLAFLFLLGWYCFRGASYRWIRDGLRSEADVGLADARYRERGAWRYASRQHRRLVDRNRVREADSSSRAHTGLWCIGLVVSAVLLGACVPDRPSRILEADVVGVVRNTTHSVDAEMTAALEDGTIVEIPRSATEFYGPGPSADRLLISGDDFNRIWYASLVLNDRSTLEGCYEIRGVAYDEPDAVIVLSGDWRGVGLRLPKREDLVVLDGFVDAEGLYRMGGEYPEGEFCVDTEGMVFALPMG